MATEFQASRTIASNVEEKIRWAFQAGESIDDVDETIYQSRVDYTNESLIYTHDITELWMDLNQPEPETMNGDISSSISWAVNEALGESSYVYEAAHDSYRDTLNAIIEDFSIPLGDADADDVEELRALVNDWRDENSI